MSFSKRELEKQQEREAPAARVERARHSLRHVLRDVQTSEGRLLDYETADGMQRALHATLRELEQLTLTLAVRERQVK
jgi:hypothetical protein